jgi:predicted enzyme related to lactoylglutathione lyase
VPPKLGLVLDCSDPLRLGAFWAEALGYQNVGTFDPYVVLLPPDRSAPKLLLQRVDEPKAGKNRAHFDLEVPDIEAEAARLEALGATRVPGGAMAEHGTSWVRMADPEGNEFCVCDAGGG